MITVTGITKHYGERIAVDDLTFTVAAGRVTGFVGPNGAGKSTTMRMMVGLTHPDHGEIRYDGVRYNDLRHPARLVGSVLDARCMHPGHTARNHLRAMAAMSSIPASRVDEVLTEVGLESAADQRTGGFSLGMRQRLALAGALLGDPQVLLLDEPSNGLDPDGIRWLRLYLTDFARQGRSVFVSSHLISELSMFADDLVVIGGGKLLAADTVEAITARQTATVVAETAQPAELARVLAGPNVTVETTGDRLVVRGTTKAAVSQLAFDNGIRLLELSEIAPSLEDTLLDMTGSLRRVRLGLNPNPTSNPKDQNHDHHQRHHPQPDHFLDHQRPLRRPHPLRRCASRPSRPSKRVDQADHPPSEQGHPRPHRHHRWRHRRSPGGNLHRSHPHRLRAVHLPAAVGGHAGLGRRNPHVHRRGPARHVGGRPGRPARSLGDRRSQDDHGNDGRSGPGHRRHDRRVRRRCRRGCAARQSARSSPPGRCGPCCTSPWPP